MSEGLFGLAGVIIGALVAWVQAAYDRIRFSRECSEFR